LKSGSDPKKRRTHVVKSPAHSEEGEVGSTTLCEMGKTDHGVGEKKIEPLHEGRQGKPNAGTTHRLMYQKKESGGAVKVPRARDKL